MAAYNKEPVTLKVLSKSYERINRKREKKGLCVLTTMEFLRKQDAGHKYAIPVCYFGTGAFIMLMALLLGGLETTLDAILLFLTIMVCFYICVHLVLIRPLSAATRREYGNILKQCTEEGVEIDELYKKYVKSKVDTLKSNNK